MTNTEIEKYKILATSNVFSIVTEAVSHPLDEPAIVIYDTESPLSLILLDAYKSVLKNAVFLDFDSVPKDVIIESFKSLAHGNLVVLIQSMDFRLNEFRIRIFLFQRGLKVIDHQHLSRNTDDSYTTYLNSLEYDSEWYRTVGPDLKSWLEKTMSLRVESDRTTLTVTGGLEEPKLNIGDYTGMKNIGGTFPIGEVFTEAKDLGLMNGSILVYAFADMDFHVSMHEPFEVSIEKGCVVGWGDSTPQNFISLVSLVKTHERALIREIGFGLNRAITQEHYLKDITAFERILGMHFSLGEKHTVFKKQGITADKTRFHIDLFPIVERVFSNEKLIFENGTYLVS